MHEKNNFSVSDTKIVCSRLSDSRARAKNWKEKNPVYNWTHSPPSERLEQSILEEKSEYSQQEPNLWRFGFRTLRHLREVKHHVYALTANANWSPCDHVSPLLVVYGSLFKHIK